MSYNPSDRDFDDPRYKAWRYSVMRRDNYTCVFCGSKGVDFEIHHIKRWCDYPKLRYATSNGVTLCKEPCHSMVTGKEQQYEPQFAKYVERCKILEGEIKGLHKKRKTTQNKIKAFLKWRPSNIRVRY